MPMTSMETPARLKVYGGVTADRPETPGPVRARVSNLQSQVDELVRKSHNQDVSGYVSECEDGSSPETETAPV